MMKKLALCALVLVLPAAALAQTPASPAGACYTATTSRLDEMLNPVAGGDEKFFSAPSGPPNVHFVIDNSCSMVQAWPIDFCSGKNHCGCEEINKLGYVPTNHYEPEIKNLNSNSYYDEWFNVGKVYEYRNYSAWSGSYGQNISNSPGGTHWSLSGARNVASSYTAACADIGGSDDRDTCRKCLATKGYFIGDGYGEWRMAGNFLNHFSPRYLMARRVLKQVIRDIQPVRMMTTVFNHVNSSATSSSYGPDVLTEWNPPCNQSDPYRNASNFFSNRQSIINTLDSDLRFLGGTPLARSLYAAGYSFQKRATDGASDHVYSQAFGSTWRTAMGISSSDRDALTEKSGDNQKSVCFSCTFNGIILLSDGEPTWDANETTVPVIGADQIPRSDCSNCQSSDLDEVARWLWNTDLRPDHDGIQRVATYTIGFGLSGDSWAQKLLRYTAQEGGGKYFPANNTSQLRQAIIDIFDDINSRNIAFSAANVASLQVSGGDQAAVIPRMSPRNDQSWLGYLWRFGLFNEFIEDVDKNGDGDRDDVFIIDADGDIVIEDHAGKFVKQASSVGAEPYWEAGTRLREKVGGTEGWQARNVWTVRDTAAPTGSFTDADGLTRFTANNWQQLKPYLGVSGTAACPTLVDLTTLQPGKIMEGLGLDITQALSMYGLGTLIGDIASQRGLLDQLCHRVLIDWTLGRDLGDEDGDGNRDETRLSVLGDIFHSSPVTVDPPVDKFLCDIGLHNQCVRTLYSNRLGVPHTPLTEENIPAICDQGAYKGDAYDKYHYDNRKREKVILVGANDGMLHAFRDSRGVAKCENGVEIIDFKQGDESGREAWAIIPPDALHRLHLQLTEGHKYFVDGDLMVRDVWVDVHGTPDLKKQPEEFKTVAIAAMGRGGTHYFAVEVQWEDQGSTRVVRDRPKFLWMFPQPATDEASLFGKTLYALAPKPPPIGPVLLQKCDEASEESDASCGTPRYDKGTEERWVAMLSGGWSPGNEKGRGVYMVDAYRGVANTVRNDNLLWKFDYKPDASGQRDEPRKFMTHSIVAPVSMVDYGANDNVRLDGFFDTAVVGDLAGQLWTFRFHQPGEIDTGTGLVKNWAGARAFQQDIQGGSSVAITGPFYLPASLGLQPDNNALRAFVGTGNRYDLLTERAGACRFDDPLTCAKYGCEVNVKSTITRAGISVTDAHTHWGSQSYSHSRQGQTTASVAACGVVNAAIETHDIGCGVGSVRTPSVRCETNAAGVYTCRRTDSTTMNVGNAYDVANNATILNNLGYNRFFGIWVYGRDPNRMFEEHRDSTGSTWKTAREFDTARLTDRRSGGTGDLVNVTTTNCPSGGGNCTGPQATASGKGWYFEYRDTYSTNPDRARSLSHKTASGASLIASCVLWNTLYPEPQQGVCATPSASRARFHQADFITGAPNCAYSFDGQRFQERSVLAPPPEPATAVQFSRKTGQIRLSTLIVEPGQDQATTVSVTSGEDVLQSVYEVPITRELHDCRHSPDGCKPTVP